MKVQYHLTPAQIQDTLACLRSDKEEAEIPSFILCYADVKPYRDTDRNTFIGLPNIALIGLFYEIRGFLQSDKASSVIIGWWDYQYTIELSMPRKTSLLTLNRGAHQTFKSNLPLQRRCSKLSTPFYRATSQKSLCSLLNLGLEHRRKTLASRFTDEEGKADKYQATVCARLEQILTQRGRRENDT